MAYPTNAEDGELVGVIRRLSKPLTPIPTGVSARIEPLTGLKAVVFDVYGTLFVSGSGDIGIAMQQSNETALLEALQAAGFTGDLGAAAQDALGTMLRLIEQDHRQREQSGTVHPEVDIGDVWQRVLRRLCAGGSLRGACTPGAARRVAVEYECRVNPVWPMPNAAGAICAAGRSGRLLGIASNAQFFTPLLFEAMLDAAPEALGFGQALCAWSYELLAAKPSLRLMQTVLHGARRAGVEPREVLYVGNDMLNDIYPAAALGCRTALFAGDQRSLRLREAEPRCAGLSPDVTLTSLAQLEAVLG